MFIYIHDITYIVLIIFNEIKELFFKHSKIIVNNTDNKFMIHFYSR